MKQEEWVGKVVELLEHASHYYPVATAGWRGIVKDTKVDDEGFAMVYIEWDRDHWLYSSGQADGWTYPAHFEVVGEFTVKDIVNEAMERRAQEDPAEDGEPPEVSEMDAVPEAEGTGSTDDSKREHLSAVFESAVAEARDSEGFVLIWVDEREIRPGLTIHVPSRVAIAASVESADLLEVQIMEMAQELFAKAMRQRMEDRDGR